MNNSQVELSKCPDIDPAVTRAANGLNPSRVEHKGNLLSKFWFFKVNILVSFLKFWF